MRRALIAALTAATSGLVAREADAYNVRKTPQGSPVRWGSETVEVLLDASLDEVDPQTRGAVSAAFGTWNAVADAPTPGVITRDAGVDEVGYRPGGENHNTVRYAPKGSDLAGPALAVTVLTFGQDGQILDADVILNGGAKRKFGVLAGAPAEAGTDNGHDGGNDKTRYDVQNVITHEAGHFMGLGEETADTSATMFITSARGEIQKRDLADDDETGIRLLYDGAAAKPATGGSCSLASGDARAPAHSDFPWLAFGLLGLWAFRRSRQPLGLAGGALAIACSVSAIGCLAGDGAADEGSGDATAKVVAATARWEGGVVVTSLTLRTVACHSRGGCPSGDVSVEVFGGTVDGITQVVGHHEVPALGDTLPLAWDDGRIAWPERFPVRRGLPDRDRHDRQDEPGGKSTLPSRTKLDPRRAHERAPAELDVIVRGEGGEVHGLTENISRGGLFVATDGVSGLQGAIELELRVPGRSTPIHARGQVRWTRGADEDQPAGLGIQFVELDGEAADLIRAMVEQEDASG